MRDPVIPGHVVQAEASLAELAKQINEEHVASEESARASVQHALNAGRLLVQAKKRLAHGQWLPWLHANVPLAERTVQAYMKLARDWPRDEEKAQRVADLSLRDALKALREAHDEPEAEPADQPVVPMPAFRPGCSYMADTNEELRFGAQVPTFVEIVPCLASPGYWRIGAIFGTASSREVDDDSDEGDDDGGWHLEYIPRGCKLDDVRVWNYLMARWGIRSIGEWMEYRGNPVLWWLEEFQARLEYMRASLGRELTQEECKRFRAGVVQQVFG